MGIKMEDKTILITGATSGLGRASAFAFAKRGANLAIVGRDVQKTKALKEMLSQKTGNNTISVFIADLEKQADIRKFAADFTAQNNQLHVLVNNAGAYFVKREETVDGYERSFALNHLAPFLLTNLLLDTLKASSPARIINVASDAHKMVKSMNWDDLMFKNNWPLLGWNVYCHSKLANMYFTFKLARMLENSGVTANCLHPGFVRSGLAKNNGRYSAVLVKFLMMFATPAEDAAKTVVWAAESDDMNGISGKYLYQKKIVASSKHAQDITAADRLWELSCELTGVNPIVAKVEDATDSRHQE